MLSGFLSPPTTLQCLPLQKRMFCLYFYFLPLFFVLCNFPDVSHLSLIVAPPPCVYKSGLPSPCCQFGLCGWAACLCFDLCSSESGFWVLICCFCTSALSFVCWVFGFGLNKDTQWQVLHTCVLLSCCVCPPVSSWQSAPFSQKRSFTEISYI